MRLRIFVAVRPGATSFLEAMSQHYDIILWTASLQAYADPVMDRVDINKRAVKRLFRESCTLLASGLTKDLSLLDVSLKDVIIIDVLACTTNSEIECRELFQVIAG
jgi:RNA polymerase II subunit A small phosphatase-like protein